MTRHKIGFALCVSVLLLSSCSPQRQNRDQPAKADALELLQQDIDSFLTEQHQEGSLNGNVLVVKNGKTIYEGSFGFADGSKEVLLDKGFRFGIGSVYKEFPAVAIMQLHEKGLVQLDEKINRYLPDLPNWSETITIENLLTYSGGLPKINWGEYFSQGKSIRDEDIMNDLLNLEELAFVPGSGYLYTNNSPFLLIKIVEAVTGQEFRQYAKQHLFAPFGLKNTVMSEQYPYLDETLMAMPFNAEFEQDEYRINIPSILFGSTAEDLYNWLEQLHSFKIVGESSVMKLTETAETENEDMQSPLGQHILSDGKIVEHTHHGSSGNYEGVVRRFNPSNLTIVILTNRKQSNVVDLSNEIRERVDRFTSTESS